MACDGRHDAVVQCPERVQTLRQECSGMPHFSAHVHDADSRLAQLRFSGKKFVEIPGVKIFFLQSWQMCFQKTD